MALQKGHLGLQTPGMAGVVVIQAGKVGAVGTLQAAVQGVGQPPVFPAPVQVHPAVQGGCLLQGQGSLGVGTIIPQNQLPVLQRLLLQG